MNKSILALSLPLALMILGCGDKTATDPKSGSETKNGSEAVVAPASTKLVVPDSLKSAAYDYMGLDESKKLTYEISTVDGLPQEMTQLVTLVSVKDGVATFDVTRESQMPGLGQQTVELSDKGLSTISDAQGKWSEPMLEMPSDLKIGKEWDAKTTITGQQQSVEAQVSNKAVSEESIKVKAGTYDCIKVVSVMKSKKSNAGSSDIQTSVFNAVTYYAKGVGLVKLVMTGKDGSGAPIKASYELVKIGE